MRLPLIYSLLRHIFNKENYYALLLTLIILALYLLTADSSPVWIYQGF